MGQTKVIQGDGRIVFHVGSSLPQEGESLYLVPGGQTAQGWGVYCSEDPILTYSGGENRRRQLDYTPIYCIPEQGQWRRGTSKKGDTVLHTEGRIILMKDLQYKDVVTPEGAKLRYYAPKECSFFWVPYPQGEDKMKRYRISELVRGENDPTFDKIQQLVDEFQLREAPVDKDILREKLQESAESGKIPHFDFTNQETKNEITEGKINFEPGMRV